MQTTSDLEKKSKCTYTLRPLREADIPAFVEYANECAGLEEAVEPISLSEWSEWYHNPMNHDKDTLAFLTNQDGSEGRIIGNLVFGRHPGETRSWGWMYVHPDYRKNGLGNALYAEYLRQADEAGVKTLIMNPSRHATLLTDFLTRRGYELERWFYDMQLPAERPVESPRMVKGFRVHTFVPGQDEQLVTHVRNVTFADHYGSVQRTVEEMTYRTKQQDFHPDGIFFAFDGDKPAGFCYTTRDPREWERRGETVGHIQLLGVMPEYRGKGLGRALLLEGVNYLRQFVALVELGVEGKNDKATALYESVGFKLHKAWANMILERQ